MATVLPTERATRSPVVQATHGAVQGVTDDCVHLSLGSPFAPPPFQAGCLRPPRPVGGWQGLRDATTPGPQPPQGGPPWTGGPDPGATEDPGDVADAFAAVERAAYVEECLNLDVCGPDMGASGLSVMVRIQGGTMEYSMPEAERFPKKHPAGGRGLPRRRLPSRSGTLVLPLIAVTLLLPMLTGCSHDPTPRDLNDPTPPSLLLTVTASKAVDGGVQTVEFGENDIELAMPGGSVFAKASDDDGVSNVELWMTETRVCGGMTVGPGLPGAPTKRVEGESTASAPTSLSVSYDINKKPLKANCSYTFEVWGKATNAATKPVSVESPVTRLHLHT